MQDKLTAAQKDLVTAVLANSDDAVIHSKLEALTSIQTDIAMLRYNKGVTKIAAAITSVQKTTMNRDACPILLCAFWRRLLHLRLAVVAVAGWRRLGGGGSAAITADALQRQAQVYAKLFEIFDRHAKRSRA